jgi:hypothetical protein
MMKEGLASEAPGGVDSGDASPVDSGDTYDLAAIEGRDGRRTTPRLPRLTLASG